MTWCVHLLQNQTKSTKITDFLRSFFLAFRTHTESVKQSIKLMISSEMPPQSLTELHEVFERRTVGIVKHMSVALWCSFQSALVRLSSMNENAKRKIVHRRSGEMSYRDIPLVENEKMHLNFVKKKLFLFFRAEYGGLGSYSTSNQLKMCGRSWGRAPSIRCLPAALISSRDG